ncbi:hypothetical protein [Microbacterium amylolyticum]|uniref:Oxidoreductase n=1 Tax=Microbacterium amylolyticum TaxID=936337 RepID=A0ABS4ZJB0_9MICO|nr:hypothetical protein [Microbacterium amylolyticum]MBP2437364.1 hypothetical protein [Microbacterium amylolyticum]
MREQYVQAGMPAPMAEAILGMSTGRRDGFTPEQSRSVITTTPSSLRGWIREELRPLL